MKKSGVYLWCLVVVQALAIVVVLVMRVHYRKLPFMPVASARMEIRGPIELTLDIFKADCGRYPTTVEGWKVMIDQPASGSLPGWRGPYFDPPAPPKDLYGHEYGYRFPGVFNTNGYDLYSLGSDGISKTGGNDLDDINNWDALSPHGGKSKGLFYGFDQIHTGAKMLLIVPLLFIVRWIGGAFSERVRALMKENLVADSVWLVMSIVVVINFFTSFPPTIWR